MRGLQFPGKPSSLILNFQAGGIVYRDANLQPQNAHEKVKLGLERFTAIRFVPSGINDKISSAVVCDSDTVAH